MFEHPDAITSWPVVGFDERSNVQERYVLVIETKLSLWSQSADYKDGKVEKLLDAAKAFAARNKFNGVRLVSVADGHGA